METRCPEGADIVIILPSAIRPFTLGRKNWLFADAAGVANASAALYSQVETAKADEIDPYQYLSDVFSKLPTMQSGEDLDHFLPWNWKRELLACFMC